MCFAGTAFSSGSRIMMPNVRFVESSVPPKTSCIYTMCKDAFPGSECIMSASSCVQGFWDSAVPIEKSIVLGSGIRRYAYPRRNSAHVSLIDLFIGRIQYLYSSCCSVHCYLDLWRTRIDIKIMAADTSRNNQRWQHHIFAAR
jgi:hypothetical protein